MEPLIPIVEHFTQSIFDQSKLSVTDGLLWGAHSRSHCNVSRGTGAEGTGMRWDGYGTTSLTHVKVAEFYHLKHSFWKWMNIMDENLKDDVWMHILVNQIWNLKDLFRTKKNALRNLHNMTSLPEVSQQKNSKEGYVLPSIHVLVSPQRVHPCASLWFTKWRCVRTCFSLRSFLFKISRKNNKTDVPHNLFCYSCFFIFTGHCNM